MPRDFLPLKAIAERQAFQQRLHHRLWKSRGPGRGRLHHLFTTPNEMAQTRLMKRIDKTIIGLPSIMIEESCVVLTQDRSGLSKPTAGQNRIDRDFGADTNPEPFQMRGYSPTRFIQLIDRTVADNSLKFLIRRLRL